MKKMNYLLLILVIVISIFGIVMITSSSYIWAEYRFEDPLKFMKSQTIFFIIGLFLMIFISRIDYHIYYKYANKIFIIVFTLLVLVLIPGIGIVRNGSRSWFGIGSLGIQPSEFMKISMIIFISKYMVRNYRNLSSIKKGVLPVLSVLLLTFGIIMLEPDFGSGMILIMISMGLFFIGGINMKFFISVGILGVIGIIVLIIIAPYRLERIISFLNPWNDPLGSGFQIIQSLYAIGPGGLFGFGLGNSRQKHFYLPEPQTDFIFSIISEELGFLGCIIVVGLFIGIILCGIRIAKKCDDLFGKFITFGIVFWIGFQTILNLMVVVGLIPVTGVALLYN